MIMVQADVNALLITLRGWIWNGREGERGAWFGGGTYVFLLRQFLVDKMVGMGNHEL